MGLYRNIPVTREAHQWFKNGDHPEDCSFRLGDATEHEGYEVRFYRNPSLNGDTLCKHCNKTMHAHGWIDTLEGGHQVCPGDFIITGVEGEKYPCKPSIFFKTYEFIGEPDSSIEEYYKD